MTNYEKLSLLGQGLMGSATFVFALWQIFINRRLQKLSDFVAISIVPGSQDAPIKLLNTGKINLYIHGFTINETTKIFDRGRLIAPGAVDSAYYWLPAGNIPKSGLFYVKIYLTDEYGKKYMTLGQGQSDQTAADGKILVTFWTFRTEKYKWNFESQL